MKVLLDGGINQIGSMINMDVDRQLTLQVNKELAYMLMKIEDITGMINKQKNPSIEALELGLSYVEKLSIEFPDKLISSIESPMFHKSGIIMEKSL